MQICLAIAALTLAVSAPGTAQNSQASDTAVVALIQAFYAARDHFDAKALDALLAPDYVEVAPRGETDRWQAVLGFYAADKATPVPPMTFGTQEVRLYRDTALVIG